MKIDPQYLALPEEDRFFLERAADEYYLSFQDLKKLITIGLDLKSWNEGSLVTAWKTPPASIKGKNRKQWALKKTSDYWMDLKKASPSYDGNPPSNTVQSSDEAGLKLYETDDDSILMGRCPVASLKTRCCNLYTLDAAVNCGYDCSYCTIQSFYHGDKIKFHSNLREKLSGLKLDPEKTYHIGTGQSSDSLLWGNKYNLLEDLFNFAGENPNIILELKTKSANISYLLENPPPANVLVTWSLNTEILIKNEERGTASLESRLDAAEKIAQKGILTGFHFHPMIYYRNWRRDYGEMFKLITSRFSPEQTALVSFGTLTFIKPVLKTIRQRPLNTKILQMPMEEIAGKYSYPLEIKRELFSFAYNSFKEWHGKVFFYLCMEDAGIWNSVFGWEFKDNNQFETAMKNAYFEKINLI